MGEHAESERQTALEQGLVHVYTGDGKGKTSAALGLVLRATGYGLRVYIVFFMKGGYTYGEQHSLARLPNVDVASFGRPQFVDPENVQPEDIAQAKQALAAGLEAMLSGKYDLVVLDEINVAVAWKLLELDEVVRLIRDKPPNIELILTGRYADPVLVEMADLVTVMSSAKHPYDQGIAARRGIEY